jgi:hypothetical protein
MERGGIELSGGLERLELPGQGGVFGFLKQCRDLFIGQRPERFHSLNRLIETYRWEGIRSRLGLQPRYA